VLTVPCRAEARGAQRLELTCSALMRRLRPSGGLKADRVEVLDWGKRTPRLCRASEAS